MLTGGEIMVKCLEAEGVDILFGYPGAAICPFYDALYDSPIRHVLVRSEQNAAHMASGYARASGRPGVCVATSGPGATNLITGIATAYMDSIPIVAITGQVNLEQLGRDVFQEADITGACESFTKHSYLVKSVEDLPRVFKEAFHIASTGRPGPVLIDVPEDVQEAFFFSSDAVKEGGFFLFDVNTPYRFAKVYGSQTFSFVAEDAAYIWENSYDPQEQMNTYDVHFFLRRPDGTYDRREEVHEERAYPQLTLTVMLENAGFTVCSMTGETGNEATQTDQRWTFLAVKERSNGDE